MQKTNPPRQQIRPTPILHLQHWAFSIGGLVAHPLILPYTELLDLPRQPVSCAIVCSALPPGADFAPRVYQAVPMRWLMRNIRLKDGATYARLIAADGYVTVLPISLLDEGFLAVSRNDMPLAEDDGAPARFLLPNRAGYKMPKWIQRIELTNTPAGGFWEERSWPLDGALPAVVRFAREMPPAQTGAPYHLRGTALLPLETDTSTPTVYLSINDSTPMPVPLLPTELRADMPIYEWSALWTPPAAGLYHLYASLAPRRPAESAHLFKRRPVSDDSRIIRVV